jgi:fructokinase
VPEEKALPLVAGVELGGTKSIAVLARGPTVLHRYQVPTRRPGETLPLLAEWFADRRAEDLEPVALGIGGFGPLSTHREAIDYGRVGTTPKEGWRGANLLDAFSEVTAGPVGLDTDVNAAGLAEMLWGAAAHSRLCVYLTIGTGVGAGILHRADGAIRRLPSEIGHVRIRRTLGADFGGCCPFHGDCAEGLLSGPAIAARTGTTASQLDASDPIWAAFSADFAELLVTILLCLTPDIVIVGGGVGTSKNFPLRTICDAADKLLAGYLPTGRSTRDILVPCSFGADTGPMGAAALALDALASNRLEWSGTAAQAARHHAAA